MARLGRKIRLKLLVSHMGDLASLKEMEDLAPTAKELAKAGAAVSWASKRTSNVYGVYRQIGEKADKIVAVLRDSEKIPNRFVGFFVLLYIRIVWGLPWHIPMCSYQYTSLFWQTLEEGDNPEEYEIVFWEDLTPEERRELQEEFEAAEAEAEMENF